MQKQLAEAGATCEIK
ncbi:MAG: hypothetical protein L0H37_00620 [Nitrosospira sp.]|nr:hypothetical protein [Nitrosospira sp.]